jgi:DNA polymerase
MTKDLSKIEEELLQIKQDVIDCKKCPLWEGRILPVIGSGSHQAKVLFIGEAPGANEDKTGVPFCGTSGKILDSILEKIDIKREDVYICNILKCRPPKNRDPLKGEIDICTGYLERQIEAIQPDVICTLGRFSMAYIMERFGLKNLIEPISKIKGKVFETDFFSKKIKIIPLYHPAVAAYNGGKRKELEEDIKVLSQFK